MATTQELLDKLKANLTSIYDKLESKGVQVSGNKNLDNLVLAIDNVGGGGGATTAKLSLADCTQEISEMEGMMANFLWGSFSAPSFDIGSISLSYQGTTIPLDELEEVSLEDFGGPAVPALVYAKEGYAPNGNPYMSALIIGMGASCEGFNMATGNMAFTEDSSKMCICGYAVEMDSTTGAPIQNPQWYFDYIELAALTVEEAYKKGLAMAFMGTRTAIDTEGSITTSNLFGEDVTMPPYALASKRFDNKVIVSASNRLSDNGCFANSIFKSGIEFESSTIGYMGTNLFNGATIECDLNLGYLESGVGSNAFVNSKILGALKYQEPTHSDISMNAFENAVINSINSDEEGTYYFNVPDGTVRLNSACGSPKKVIINCANIYDAGFDSHKFFLTRNRIDGSYLKEVYINKSGSPTQYQSENLFVCGSIKKLVAPNVTCQQWVGDGAYQLEYADIYDLKEAFLNSSGGIVGQSLTTLILRAEDREIVQSLDNIAYRDDCLVYVADSKLAEYQSWYNGTAPNFVSKLHAISELPTEG